MEENPMQSFEFYTPTHIVFGAGTEAQAGSLAAAQGAKHVLVVYGGKSARNSGLIDRVTRSLEDAGIAWETLGGVQPNPRLSLVRKGIELVREKNIDLLLAVGGGSVIDTAKAIADGAANPQYDVWNDIWLKKVTISAALPVGAVLTIPAAGSETSDSAVITNDETKEKRGVNSPFHRPKFAILNPELTYTLPPFQLTCGIVDIMMHTLERYFNPITTNELSDEFAEGLLRTTIRNGRRAVAHPGDYQAMSELMWCGSRSHNGLTGLGGKTDFATHQLGHELGAMFDVTHGASLSATWGSWARYVIVANPARFAQYAVKVWGFSHEGKDDMALGLEGIAATESFFRELHMPTCLSELGIGVLPEETVQELAYRCAFKNTRTIGTFRVLDHNDILKIYQAANH